MSSMRVKARNRRLYVLRATYVPAVRDQQGRVQPGTGRAKEAILGSLPLERADDGLPSALADKLSARERHQVEQLLAEHARTRAFQRMGAELAAAHGPLDALVESLRHYPAEIALAQLNALAAGAQDVQRAVRARARRQGMTLGAAPKPRRKTTADIPGQQTLLDG